MQLQTHLSLRKKAKMNTQVQPQKPAEPLLPNYTYKEHNNKSDKANSRHFSQNISVKPHCPSLLYSVCVCVCILQLYVPLFYKKNFYYIFHLNVHYVCMLFQRFEPQGRRFTNVPYYY